MCSPNFSIAYKALQRTRPTRDKSASRKLAFHAARRPGLIGRHLHSVAMLCKIKAPRAGVVMAWRKTSISAVDGHFSLFKRTENLPTVIPASLQACGVVFPLPIFILAD